MSPHCLEENVLLDFVEGRLLPDAREAAIAHLDACELCREVVAAAVVGGRDTLDETSPLTPLRTGRLLVQGERVGRYVILNLVGAGGMGVVYAAYDPELDRKIALKLLRPSDVGSAGGETLERRLLREAQTMARLTHPHIVAVYDAGTFEDSVFIAMEYVSGKTLGEWLRASPRPWRDVLALLRKAGKGLAAAHAAGIVHRDFKPDNVLVGNDGRVLVSDFGLARSVEREAMGDPTIITGDDAPVITRKDRSGEMTLGAHALAGTPAYMSPEQIDGQAADERSDLYAFCVTAHEALVGRRPFVADTLPELQAAIKRGRVQPQPGDRPVPKWIRRALLRGLSVDPASRYESIDALLAVLGRDPVKRWMRIGAGLVVAFAVVGAVVLYDMLREDPRRTCAGSAAQLASLWNEARRSEIEAAFRATGLAYAGDSWARAQAAIGRYADAWTAMYRESCEATRVRGEQPEALFERRLACLHERRTDLSALLDLLARADKHVVPKAIAASAALPSLAACSDATSLAREAPLPDSPELRKAVEQVRGVVARVRALANAGMSDEAFKAAAPAVEQARVVGYKPVIAEALAVFTHAARIADKAKEAEAAGREAYLAALASRRDRLLAESFTELAFVMFGAAQRNQEALSWVAHGAAAIERLGQPPELLGSLRSVEGLVLGEEKQFAKAEQVAREAFELARRSAGDESIAALTALANWGKILRDAGRHGEGRDMLRRAVALAERVLGGDHPQLADHLTRLALVEYERYAFAKAARALERALAIRTKVLGADTTELWREYGLFGTLLTYEDDHAAARRALERGLRDAVKRFGAEHPHVAMPLNNLGLLAMREGRYDEAIARYNESMRLTRKLGPGRPEMSYQWIGLGMIEMCRGRWADARSHFERALELRTGGLGPNHPETATALTFVGLAEMRLGNQARARSVLEQSLSVRSKALDAEHPDVSDSLVALALVDLEEQAPQAALSRLERAAVIQRKRGAERTVRADRLFAHARALWRLAGDRARARVLAERAAKEYARVPCNTRELNEVRAWLASPR